MKLIFRQINLLKNTILKTIKKETDDEFVENGGIDKSNDYKFLRKIAEKKDYYKEGLK